MYQCPARLVVVTLPPAVYDALAEPDRAEVGASQTGSGGGGPRAEAPHSDTRYRIRLALPDDLPALADIERSAADQFRATPYA